MNVKRILWIVIMFIMISVVSFSFVLNAVAEIYKNTDKIETLKIILPTTPNICIFEANPEITDDWETIEAVTISGIKHWETSMNEKYPDGDWEIKIHKTIPWAEHAEKDTHEFPNCNIMFNYEDIIGDDQTIMGTTSINFNDSRHKFMFVNVYLEQYKITKNININFDTGEMEVTDVFESHPMPFTVIENIIIHEFGHTLGIGHYKINTELKLNEMNYDRSVMVPSISPFEDSIILEITDVDVEIIKKLYGKDGWKSPTPVYTIKQCDIFIGILHNCK